MNTLPELSPEARQDCAALSQEITDKIKQNNGFLRPQLELTARKRGGTSLRPL